MDDAVYEEDYKGYHIQIIQDDNAINPREDGMLGQMICFHGRYTLGDKHSVQADQFGSWDEQEVYLRKELGAVILLPLYLYDHGNITMNTTGFSCPWDSGRVGTIIVTKTALLKEYGGQRVTKRMIERATKVVESEVKEYDHYIQGNVYGYTIYGPEPGKDDFAPGPNEEPLESCWNFIGDYDNEDYGALKEARSTVDSLVEQKLKAKMAADLTRTGLEE